MIRSSLDKKVILLVDDEKALTDTLSMLLETRGYSVDVAYTATEAFKKVSANHDLIILDLILPDYDGFEVCRRLKNENSTRHIPIIMMSAHSLFEDKVEGLYLGADDFLTKPCAHEELFARMEAVMRRGGNIRQDRQEEVLICELRRVLDESLLVPFFQPIYKLRDRSLYGLEILSRPKISGILSNPEIFFKTAIRYGLYTELEMLAWSCALGELSGVVRDEKVFLNCNPYFIESADFARVKKIFESNEISTKNVIMEITERSAIRDFKIFFEKLQLYRDYGFHFAVDDVGGGYASLESIVETKPEIVKIDRHIVSGASHDVFKKSIIKFIVAFCQDNNIISIAEGIETEADLQITTKLGVDCGQGFYLYKPTSKLDFDAFRSL